VRRRSVVTNKCGARKAADLTARRSALRLLTTIYYSSFHRHFFLDTHHSYLSATMGSTLVARRAGM
jgi:hypothetical protein